MKPPVSHCLSSSTPDRVNIFLPAALIAVNNSVSLSPLSLPFQLLLRWCMFFTVAAAPQAGCAPAARQLLLWSPQASEDRFNRNRKQFIARVATPLIQPHESSRAHHGETPGKVPVPSTRCGRILGREEGRQGDSSFSLPPSPCTSVCMCMWARRRRGAHLSSSSRVTLLHTRFQRGTPKHRYSCI